MSTHKTKGLFAKKSIKSLIDSASQEKHGLKRHLGALNIVSLGLGAIIGAGIFVLTGEAAAAYAGPGIIISFLIAGLICVFAALCYAELASLIPTSGSAYSYAYAAMGELPAWIIGWGLTLEYLFSASTVSVGWSGYVVSFLRDLGFNVSNAWATPTLKYDAVHGWEASGSFLNLPAMLIIAILGVLVSVGIKMASRLNNLLVIIKLSVVAVFIICGIAYINTDNWTPLIPENTGVFGQYGWSGIIRGAGVVFFAFIGFDALSTLAQEAKNPQKDLPIGMLGSLGICTLLYIVMALILTGIVSYTHLGVPDPIAIAINALGQGFFWLRPIIKIAIIAGLTSVILVMLVGQSRIFYSMATDGLMPKPFAKIHAKSSTPLFTTIVVMIAAMILAGTCPVEILGFVTSMGALLAFAIVCFGVLVLRYTQPKLHRPFKCPLVPWVPLIGSLVCLIQMAFLPGIIWMVLIVWMCIGFWVYYAYGQKHSLVRNG